MPDPDPMRCDRCDESHTEWAEAGSAPVEGYHHRGVEYRYECDRCGNTVALLGL